MKKTINIHVEGQGEICFFSFLLNRHFGYDFSFHKEGKINMIYKSDSLTLNLKPFNLDLDAGGFDNKKIRDAAKEIQINKEKNEINIFIIDADTESHKPAGGFKNREKYLEDLKSEFKIEFYFFLIPDHSSPGNLESLLNNLVSEKGKPFFECLTNYSNCLSSLLQNDIPVELKQVNDFHKKKFEWYIFNMLGNKHRKETLLSQRDYFKDDLWNLEGQSLSPLLGFLNSYLPKNSTEI